MHRHASVVRVLRQQLQCSGDCLVKFDQIKLRHCLIAILYGPQAQLPGQTPAAFACVNHLVFVQQRTQCYSFAQQVSQ